MIDNKNPLAFCRGLTREWPSMEIRGVAWSYSNARPTNRCDKIWLDGWNRNLTRLLHEDTEDDRDRRSGKPDEYGSG